MPIASFFARVSTHTLAQGRHGFTTSELGFGLSRLSIHAHTDAMRARHLSQLTLARSMRAAIPSTVADLSEMMPLNAVLRVCAELQVDMP